MLNKVIYASWLVVVVVVWPAFVDRLFGSVVAWQRFLASALAVVVEQARQLVRLELQLELFKFLYG
jgi:hypothetical protein